LFNKISKSKYLLKGELENGLIQKI